MEKQRGRINVSSDDTIIGTGKVISIKNDRQCTSLEFSRNVKDIVD